MTDRELMQQALEALERCVSTCFDQRAHEQVMSRPEHFVNQNITALRERLAQPEQEPVVWMYQDKSTHEVRFQKHMRGFVDHGATYETPLYTTPPRREWQGLAADSTIQTVPAQGGLLPDATVNGMPAYEGPLSKAQRGCAECGKSGGWALYCVECMEKMAEQEPVATVVMLAEAIEAKLKEKNNG